MYKLLTIQTKKGKVLIMKNAMENLKKELMNRGIIYDRPDIPDEYEQCAFLEGVYEWGFTIIHYCNVLDPVIAFYDWKYQRILSLDVDEFTTYTLHSGRLVGQQRFMFSDRVIEINVNLNDGAPVHMGDIAAIGYAPNLSHFEDKRFYALHDGRIYFKEDGASLRLLENVTVENLIRQGYEIIDHEYYNNNVDVLNDMLCKKY